MSSADGHCRRWSEAYPNVFAEDVLRAADPDIDLEFRTFACTGAITRNIHDPRGPGNGVTQDDLIDTNKPSHQVPSLRYDSDTGELHPPPGSWEPRQAASLAATQGMADVDMITITIGGNDAGFADVLRKCVLGGRDCGRGVLPDDYDEIPARLGALLTQLKRAASNASIFMLGYPHLTPEPVEANRRRIEVCGLHGQPLQASSINSGVIPAVAHFLLGGNVADTAISFEEAVFLRQVSTEMNEVIEAAATAARVHFVDVNTGSLSQHATGFVGHSPCGVEPWLKGFVAYEGSGRHRRMPAADDSFHPNEKGHRAYARLLESYIESQVSAGVHLNESGLPVNPGTSQ